MKETLQKVMEKMMSGMMKPEDMPHMMETMMDSVFVQGNDTGRPYRLHAEYDAALHVHDVF